LKRFILNGADCFALLFAPHDTEEVYDGAHAFGQRALPEQSGFVDRFGRDGEMAFQGSEK
jgi:hypothetical protein